MDGVAEQSPLLRSFSRSEESAGQPLKRTGSVWTAMAHIITGVIGAGVLSLAWSTAQLGWIAGPLSIIAFAAITLTSTYLLCDCYRFPDPEYGPIRNRSFMEAVRLYLGERSHKVCGVIAQVSFYGGGIAYTITCATSVRNRRPPLGDVGIGQRLGSSWSGSTSACEAQMVRCCIEPASTITTLASFNHHQC